MMLSTDDGVLYWCPGLLWPEHPHYAPAKTICRPVPGGQHVVDTESVDADRALMESRRARRIPA
jgi:hypothetical protein